jgi:hypothetical protein
LATPDQPNRTGKRNSTNPPQQAEGLLAKVLNRPPHTPE